MICNNCGKQNPEGAPFCSECGARLARSPSQEPDSRSQQVKGGAAPAPEAPPGAHAQHLAGYPREHRESTGMATASLVLGILGLLMFPLGLVAFVLGLMVLVQRRPGRGMAIAGVALGALSLVLGVLFLLLSAALFPVFARTREKARHTSCLSNVKQLMLADLMYAQDYDEHFPPAHKWAKATVPYFKNAQILVCPGDMRPEKHRDGELLVSYCMSEQMGNVPLRKVAAPALTGVLFDGTQLWGDHGAAEARHNGGLSVGYADGHAKWNQMAVFTSAPLTPDGSPPP